MKLNLSSITLGCPDPSKLAHFYATLLGGHITESEPSWVQMSVTGDYGTMRLNFEREAQWREPVWPSVADRQHITQHLDIEVDDLDEAVQWATSCGARLASEQLLSAVRVMLDPAGHPLCLFKGD